MANETMAREDGLAKMRELIKEIDFCMLTTVAEDGSLHSRPMSVNGEVEFDGDLWFFTYGASHKAWEAQANPQANASFANPKSQSYVSVSGTASLVRDKEKIKELWQPTLKAWFPRGVDEPDIALLKIDGHKAEYWDSPTSVMAHAIGLVKSAVTGHPAPVGENKSVNLG